MGQCWVIVGAWLGFGWQLMLGQRLSNEQSNVGPTKYVAVGPTLNQRLGFGWRMVSVLAGYAMTSDGCPLQGSPWKCIRLLLVIDRTPPCHSRPLDVDNESTTPLPLIAHRHRFRPALWSLYNEDYDGLSERLECRRRQGYNAANEENMPKGVLLDDSSSETSNAHLHLSDINDVITFLPQWQHVCCGFQERLLAVPVTIFRGTPWNFTNGQQIWRSRQNASGC